LAVRQNTSYYQQEQEKMRNTNSSLERAVKKEERAFKGTKEYEKI
jgi:hypothetical protein